MAMVQYNSPQNPNPALKSALVKFSGGTRNAEEVLVGPGTTSEDLLDHLGLDNIDYGISWRTPNHYLDHHELLYPKIEDGDLLYVSSKVDAGE